MNILLLFQTLADRSTKFKVLNIQKWSTTIRLRRYKGKKLSTGLSNLAESVLSTLPEFVLSPLTVFVHPR